MRKNYSNFKFESDEFKPSKESVEIFEELNAISEEIDQCRARNLNDILTA